SRGVGRLCGGTGARSVARTVRRSKMSAILPAGTDGVPPASTTRRSSPMTNPPARRANAPWADWVFALLARLAAVLTLSLLAGIIISLVVGAWPAIKEYGLGFLTSTEWDPVQ